MCVLISIFNQLCWMHYSDVNECLENNGGCKDETICVNTEGGSYCDCPEGSKYNHDHSMCVG